MGRLTDDMARLVGEIHAARRARERSMQDLARGARERRRRMAHLRSTWAADVVGARAAWAGAALPSGAAGVPAPGRPGRRDVEAADEAVLREGTERGGRLEAERGASAPAKAQRARHRRARP